MGTLWNRSGTVERYADDLRASGAKAFFFEGGTTTPLTVYRDIGQGSPFTHPVLADANGRWPDIFIPFITSYDVQVTTADDVQLTYTLEIPNPDLTPPVVPTDATHKVQTGMIHAEFINNGKVGFVRLNGRTIGDPSSGATERADPDTSDLFTYLWNNLSDTIAPVSGGRGVSASADFDVSKTITLPDLRGAILIGLDDMGAAAGTFFTGLTFGVGSAIIPGSSTGANVVGVGAHTHTGTTAVESSHVHTGNTAFQSASHTHTGTTGAESVGHTHTFSGTTSGQSADHTHTVSSLFNSQNSTAAGGNPPGGLTMSASSGGTSNDHSHDYSGTTSGETASHVHAITTGVESANHQHLFTSDAGTAHSHTFTTNITGEATPSNLPRSLLVTWFIKL